MDSAFTLSKDSNNPLTIYWLMDKGCNCGFHELFQPLPDTVAEIKDVDSLPFLYANPRKLKVEPLISIYKALQNRKFDKAIFHLEVNQLHNNGHKFQELKSKQEILIEAHVRFYETGPKPWYQQFVPLPHIQDKISKITDRFTKDTIGVHIRRTDNKHAIEKSPLELFVQVMKKELEFVPETNFFVASDSEEVKAELTSIFGDKIILSSQEKGSRDTADGMVDAVVDLYSLAASRKILGSYWSSFSHTASHIADIEEVTVSKDQLPAKYAL